MIYSMIRGGSKVTFVNIHYVVMGRVNLQVKSVVSPCHIGVAIRWESSEGSFQILAASARIDADECDIRSYLPTGEDM